MAVKTLKAAVHWLRIDALIAEFNMGGYQYLQNYKKNYYIGIHVRITKKYRRLELLNRLLPILKN